MKLVNDFADAPGIVTISNLRKPPRLPKNMLEVLRLVRARDPYRRLDRKNMTRRGRQRTLDRLSAKGLIRMSREGFWRTTPAGMAVLLFHPSR